MNKFLEYSGTFFAICGALLIALDIDQTLGYAVFLVSGAFLIPHAVKISAFGLLTMQSVFAIINFLGLFTRIT